MIQKTEYSPLKKHFFTIRQLSEYVLIMLTEITLKILLKNFIISIKVDISERLTSTFEVIPKRWRVERTFS